MQKPEDEVTLVSLIKQHIDDNLEQLHTSLPGRIESYDAATQKANVKPLLKVPNLDENGETSYLSIPVITDVPVVFPGANGFRCTFPMTKGDTVLIMFSESSLDSWLSTGKESEPNAGTRHDISDAFILPGLNPFSSPLSNAPTTTMSLGADSGVTIEFSETAIKIGSGTSFESVILGDTYRTAEDVLLGFIGAAFAALGTDAALTTSKAACAAVAAPLSTFLGAAAAYKSIKVKVE